MIAERNFGVGEVILREKPLVAWQVQEESVGSYRAFLEACVALSETALKLVVDMARPDFDEGEVANGAREAADALAPEFPSLGDAEAIAALLAGSVASCHEFGVDGSRCAAMYALACRSRADHEGDSIVLQ